jgi:hypothetical protein
VEISVAFLSPSSISFFGSVEGREFQRFELFFVSQASSPVCSWCIGTSWTWWSWRSSRSGVSLQPWGPLLPCSPGGPAGPGLSLPGPPSGPGGPGGPCCPHGPWLGTPLALEARLVVVPDLVEEPGDKYMGGTGGSGALPGPDELGLLGTGVGVDTLELCLVLELCWFRDKHWLRG